jgi:DNA-binding NarL/FixJ family response regulator
MAVFGAGGNTRNAAIFVLLIEDNVLISDALERLASISKLGIQFERAATLAAGIDRLQSRTYDAVLLDLDLPDSRGVTTLRQIMAHAPDANVLIFSTDPEEDAATQVAAHEPAGLVVKGEVSIEDLVTQITAMKSWQEMPRSASAQLGCGA